jgi:peptidoglycan-associated lipoprotein
VNVFKEECMTMRHMLAALAVTSLLSVGCSKKQPEVAPTPTTEPQPTTPVERPAPSQPTGPDRATCDAAIASLVADVGQMVNFDTDKYDIRPMDAGVLDTKVLVLQSHPMVRIRIVGHADERYTDEYNLILGTRRAEAAKDYLVQRGIDASRIETASLGETAPLDPGHTEAAWAKNRRGEFIVTAGRETLASHIQGCQ